MKDKTRKLTCREFITFLLDYETNGLEQGERATFETHLETCPDCVDYLRTYRETVRLSKSAFESDETQIEAAPENLIQAILAARPK